jgi:hypothetical protein
MVVEVIVDGGEPEPYKELLVVKTQYYTGSLSVDGVAMHKEAEHRRTLGEGSIVHAHLYREICNEDCVNYR